MRRMFSAYHATPSAKKITGSLPSKKKLKKREKARQRIQKQIKQVGKAIKAVRAEDARSRSGDRSADTGLNAYIRHVKSVIRTVSKAVEQKTDRAHL